MDITDIFCFIDDFCQFFEPLLKKNLLKDGKVRRNRKGRMSLSEIMTILVLFHQSQMKTFKDFYLRVVKASSSACVKTIDDIMLMPNWLDGTPWFSTINDNGVGRIF